VTVVDNNSPDGSGAALQAMFAPAAASTPAAGPETRRDVHVIRSGRNLGFAGGMNRGIAAALGGGAEFVLLVNSDVWLAPDATALLLDAARAHPQSGIFAPLIVSRREPGVIASAGIDYSSATGRMRNRLAGAPLGAAPSQPYRVTAASGCVMLIRRAVFERAGPLDEAYFFSFEDVELCVRAAMAGFATMCVPGARAWHEGSGSMGHRSPRRVYFATRNHLRLASGLEPSAVRRGIRAAGIVGLNVAYVIRSPDAPLFAGLAAVARGARDHLLGRYGADPAA
jgi:GT2 family glycosyltransferase